jgi:hypothetical protein
VEDATDLSVNGAPQGRRSLTGATVVARPFTAVPERKPVPLPAPELPPLVANPIIPPAAAVATLVPPKRERAHFEYREPMPIDQTLEQETPVPLRITLVTSADKEEKKERPLKVTPAPPPQVKLSGFANTSITQLLRGTALPLLEPPELHEARAQIAKLKEQLRKALEKSEQFEVETVELRQKVGELTLAIHRLKLENIKLSDDVTRKVIKFENVKQRLEICIREIAARDDEIMQLKREIAALKRQQAPVNESLLKLRGAEAEKMRLEKEQQKRLEMAAVAENAKKNAGSEEMRTHLDNIIARQRQTVAKLEAQRRLWTEIERKQIMSVLGAMSLLANSQIKTVREVLPQYSPFATSKVEVLRDVLKRSKAERAVMTLEPVPSTAPPPRELIYGKKLAQIGRVDHPPLTTEEKKLVFTHREPPEVSERLMKLVSEDEERNSLGDAQIEIRLLNCHSGES